MATNTIRIAAGLVGATLVVTIAVATYPYLTGADPAAQAQTDKPRRSSLAANEAKPPAKTSATAIRSTAESSRRTTSQPAHVEPYERTDVYAKASGFVEKVHVDIGDSVKKDQILADLWVPDMEQDRLQNEAAVEESKSSIEQAKANVHAADAMIDAATAKSREAEAKLAAFEADVAFRKNEYARFAKLAADSALNESLVDEKLYQLKGAEAALLVAKASIESADANANVERAKQLQAQAELANAVARLKVAQSKLRNSEILLAYGKVRAPYDAIVTRRLVDTGFFVTSPASTKTEPLFTVERGDALRIVADIPESESTLVQIGQLVSLKVDAIKDRSYPGRVRRTARVLDAKTRTLRIEAELDELDEQLRPGMFGVLTITFAE